jgi:prepilin-type N-terminal cleavage/methylation domain-containing protein
MDFKDTSTKSTRSGNRAGFTLIEVMVAMGLGGILLAVIASVSLWSGKTFAAMANYTQLDSASRNALDRLTREIREVESLHSYTEDANQKELKLVAGTNGQFLYIRYNKAAKTLTRYLVGDPAPETLLRDCTVMNFNLYQRNTVSNSFNQFPVYTGTNASLTCKVIQMDWICSRKLLPTELLNSESIQTAKIVIRHH